MNIIQVKLCDALVEFQTMHITECFKYWYDHWAHCRKAQGDQFEEDNVDHKAGVVMEK